MNISNCPHCSSKLGNFLYADACPHCHKALEHNDTSKLTVKAPNGKPGVESFFLVKLFRGFVRLIET